MRLYHTIPGAPSLSYLLWFHCAYLSGMCMAGTSRQMPSVSHSASPKASLLTTQLGSLFLLFTPELASVLITQPREIHMPSAPYPCPQGIHGRYLHTFAVLAAVSPCLLASISSFNTFSFFSSACINFSVTWRQTQTL